MRHLLLSVLLLPLLFCVSCSQSPDVQGLWKNTNGETLTFNADSTVMMGMEGVEGGLPGRFSVDRDTVRITTLPAVDELGEYTNEYMLAMREERLQLVSFSLVRGSDYPMTFVADLAKRLRKSESDYAFSRVESK